MRKKEKRKEAMGGKKEEIKRTRTTMRKREKREERKEKKRKEKLQIDGFLNALEILEFTAVRPEKLSLDKVKYSDDAVVCTSIL